MASLTSHATPPRRAPAEAEARAVAEAAADARRGPPPKPQRAFRVPMECVPDLLMVWEFTQVRLAMPAIWLC